MNRIINPTNAVNANVVTASTALTAASMVKDWKMIYLFVSSTACWIKQGDGAQTASIAGAGCQYVPANTPILLAGIAGTDLAVIRDAVDGKCSLNLARQP